MNVFTTDKIRNVVLLGHGGCGKTSLVEAIAYLAGFTNRMGTVENGNTISDYDKEEIKRKISLKTTVVPVPWEEYKINLLQCRPLQTRGIGSQGVKPKVRDYFFRIRGNFMGGNVALPVRYLILVDVEAYLDLSEQKKYHAARCIGRLNQLLRDEHTVLLGPGRWGTTTPSLGVPVNYTEISHFDCLCELAYSSHGLRPELSYGSHFFQDLVEAGTFYTALYRGEAGCEFHDALFEAYPNRYGALLGAESEPDMEKVIRVLDTENRAILYSEIASQECFLALI